MINAIHNLNTMKLTCMQTICKLGLAHSDYQIITLKNKPENKAVDTPIPISRLSSQIRYASTNSQL